MPRSARHPPRLRSPMIRSPLMVRRTTMRNWPPKMTASASAPSTSAGLAACARPLKASATAGAPRISASEPSRWAAVIGAEHHLGIQHREQPLEVAVARGLEEGLDDLLLPAEIGVRRRRALHPAAGAAGQLPRRSGRAADDRRDLLERHGEHVVQHEGKPFGRRQRFQHHQQRGADGIGHAPHRAHASSSTTGSGTCGPIGSSRRDLRERSMSRQTRATTVVSQPPRFSTALVSERLSRSQVSCTASSTSLVEPSMR